MSRRFVKLDAPWGRGFIAGIRIRIAPSGFSPIPEYRRNGMRGNLEVSSGNNIHLTFAHEARPGHAERDLRCEFAWLCVASSRFNVCGHTKCEFARAIANLHFVLRNAKNNANSRCENRSRCGPAVTVRPRGRHTPSPHCSSCGPPTLQVGHALSKHARIEIGVYPKCRQG